MSGSTTVPAVPMTYYGTPRMACDADGIARAAVVVVRGSRELHMCKHHFERHELALVVAGWRVVVDTREDLR